MVHGSDELSVGASACLRLMVVTASKLVRSSSRQTEPSQPTEREHHIR